ncbi:hypothetical protein HDU93_009990 [Gonapodya sp. JEL0774]|nr:hypothetical protein HDU93_009990 [Gonapodya sp. JEL0774]
MTFPLYNATANLYAMATISFTVRDLSSVLDTQKLLATNGTLFYLMTPNAEVVAMSGLGGNQGALMRQDATGAWILRKIWEYSADDYPLLVGIVPLIFVLFNVSARTVFAYSGGNLSSNFDDATFSSGAYFFQVTTLTYGTYKWIIVSGAPSGDYLADTLQLNDNLSSRLWTTQRNIIIIAVVIVIALSAASILFTEMFISRPLNKILEGMKKGELAANFDFSMVRSGSLAVGRSPITEISDTQENFMTMLKKFADAVQSNRALIGKTSSGANSSGGKLMSNTATASSHIV